MAWTYSGNPGSSDRDSVRFRIGDTDINSQLLSDEEIDYLLVEYKSPGEAAYQAAIRLGAKFGRLKSKTVGSLSIQYGELTERFYQLADRLKAENRSKLRGAPIATGISRGGKSLQGVKWDGGTPQVDRI
jgi:hypothetical protein